MQAEVRLVAAQAAALRLPVDSPPELIEACSYMDGGDLVASKDYKSAQDSVIAQL